MEPSGSEPLPESVTLFAGRVMVWSAPALAIGDWFAAEAPAISSQLMFHPAVEIDWIRMVWVPALRLMALVTVCHVCQVPVLGIVTVESTAVPLLTWN